MQFEISQKVVKLPQSWLQYFRILVMGLNPAALELIKDKSLEVDSSVFLLPYR